MKWLCGHWPTEQIWVMELNYFSRRFLWKGLFKPYMLHALSMSVVILYIMRLQEEKWGGRTVPRVWVQWAEGIAVAYHCWCLSPEIYALFCWRAWGCRKGRTVKGTTQEQPKTPVNFLSAQVILLTEQPGSSAACSVTTRPSYSTATTLSAEAAFPFLMMNDVTFFF